MAQLEENFKKIKFEKTQMENEWATPESHKRVLQDKESLKSELKTERRNKQILANKLETILNQNLDETIQTKLQGKKDEQEQLKISLNNKLDDAQKVYLKMLLTSQEQLDGLIFGGVEERFHAPTKSQLQQAKDELVAKLSSEEIEGLCEMQTEITKLKEQEKQ